MRFAITTGHDFQPRIVAIPDDISAILIGSKEANRATQVCFHSPIFTLAYDKAIDETWILSAIQSKSLDLFLKRGAGGFFGLVEDATHLWIAQTLDLGVLDILAPPGRDTADQQQRQKNSHRFTHSGW